MTDIAYAFDFAAWHHRDQKRKYTGEPYINHPLEVANIVRSVDHTPEMVMAAFLHDVVEDCDVNHSRIYKLFGETVGDLVWWLTDISKPEDGNRALRKRLDRMHLSGAPAEAQTIKLADLISNTFSIVERDPDFAKVYLAEKRLLLPMLDKGDKKLWYRAAALAGWFK